MNMKKRFLAYAFVISLFGIVSCSKENSECVLEEFELKNNTTLLSINPPKIFLDSLQTAFYEVIKKIRCDDPNVANTYDFVRDMTGNAVVQLDIPGRTFHVNAELIREYTWNGFLLIALHECFHIYGVRNASNEEAHEAMVESSLYKLWLEWVFGPNSWYLVYVGLENTSLYENLPEDTKGDIKNCIKKIT